MTYSPLCTIGKSTLKWGRYGDPYAFQLATDYQFQLFPSTIPEETGAIRWPRICVERGVEWLGPAAATLRRGNLKKF
jgi:hypothetical protein